jgi:hypothetical protein
MTKYDFNRAVEKQMPSGYTRREREIWKHGFRKGLAITDENISDYPPECFPIISEQEQTIAPQQSE